MKTLVLIRHAKSSWKFPDLKDLDRPLKKRGLSDAPLMAKILKDIPVKPDFMITSPAVRAKTTAELIAKEFGLPDGQIAFVDDLYPSAESRLMEQIRSLDDMYSVVFLIGHNPGLTDLANTLTGESIDNIPTTGAVGILFECDLWAEAGKECSKKMFFEYPGMHKKKTSKKSE